MGGEGGRHTSLDIFLTAQKLFVILTEAPKLTLCSLPTSDQLYTLIDTCQRSAISLAYKFRGVKFKYENLTTLAWTENSKEPVSYLKSF